MSYQDDIFSALKGDPAVAGIVAGRIYADIADQGAVVPYLVFQIISVRGETSHDGVRNIEFPSVQFSCWAKTKREAVTLAAKVNALVDGNTLAGASNTSMIFSNQLGQYDQETKLFGEILEYSASSNTNT